MAKRRTKKDKIIARLRRQAKIRKKSQELKKQRKAPKTGSANLKKTKKRTAKEADVPSDLFSYNPKLIARDLKRTLFWSLIAFAIEIGLYLSLRH